MSDRRKKDTWKWIIGMIVAGALGISGWMFGGLQNAQAATHNQLIEKDTMFETYVNKFSVDIAEIKTDLKYIKDRITKVEGAN